MKKIVFLIGILLPFTATGETMMLKYTGYWEGLKAATASFKNVENNGRYHVETEAATAGIVKTLTNFSSHTGTDGKIENGDYKPEHYQSDWVTKKGSQKITINFAASGLASETADPPENRKKRPLVADKFKQDTLDLVSTFFHARTKIKKIVETGEALPQKFQVKAFDGRRVFDANFTVVGYENKKIDGMNQKLLHVTLNRTAIAGFNKKELEKLKSLNPLFDIYADENYILVLGQGQVTLGHAELRLAAKCLGDDCK